MADTQETIVDIIAKMRQGMNPNGTAECQYLESDICMLADRLEAAHKREKAAIEADALAVGGIVEAERQRERGDAAKLREAVEKVIEIANKEWDASRETSAMWEIWEICKAALAAPPRNCDNLKTSWEVLKEWHEGIDTAHDIVRLLDWLLAPATEKEGGNDGNE